MFYVKFTNLRINVNTQVPTGVYVFLDVRKLEI